MIVVMLLMSITGLVDRNWLVHCSRCFLQEQLRLSGTQGARGYQAPQREEPNQPGNKLSRFTVQSDGYSSGPQVGCVS